MIACFAADLAYIKIRGCSRSNATTLAMFSGDVRYNVAPGPSRKPTVDFIALEKSGKLLNEQLNRDARLLPELRDLLGGQSLSVITLTVFL